VPTSSEPRVTCLSTTPIKGLALHHPPEVELISTGAVGDRDFFLVDEHGVLASVTRLGELVRLRAEYDRDAGRLAIASDGGDRWEEGVRLGDTIVCDFYGQRRVPARRVLGPWDAIFSELAGIRLTLVQAAEPGDGSDIHAVTLVGEGSLAELARRGGVDEIDPRRFRMLIRFSPTEAHVEDTWAGRTVSVGTALLRVGGPVPRCAATTRDPDHGRRDLPVVSMIQSYRGTQPNEFGEGVNFGVYADVVRPGRVRTGDRLILEA
jgi:uncharacterized protein YcbX